MNKICTSIEQSKKLIELGIDINTADMYYSYDYNIDEYENDAQIIPQSELGQHFSLFQEDILALSLTALLKILPYSARLERGSSTELYCVTLPNELKSSDWYIEPIDAAFEMICWLKENKKL